MIYRISVFSLIKNCSCDSLSFLRCCGREFQAYGPAMLNDRIMARMLTVCILGPVTHSYLLTGDFDGRSPWWQACTAPQGILEPNHAATCEPVCKTCTLLAPAHAANEVCPWLWLIDEVFDGSAFISYLSTLVAVTIAMEHINHVALA